MSSNLFFVVIQLTFACLLALVQCGGKKKDAGGAAPAAGGAPAGGSPPVGGAARAEGEKKEE
ncbi:unnamed protein product [Nippostrongylus brasiliensis]|uniref:Uncharacterized protein n=1 Tax=Nippostrongylus brasiliensis TaxID=27835 RepID=A0A0N4Y842_NIPBR|nr:unnamed protein product [Nippostrongylus brasiliensis]